MEYLGRLWLVGRKNKKDREASPQKRRCDEESRALKTDLASAVESGLTSTTAAAAAEFPRRTDTIIDIAQFPRPNDCCSNPTTTTTTTAASLDTHPRSSGDAAATAAFTDDVEYLEYERHVQAQARARSALFGAPGGRHAWKTLIFWKRRHSNSSSSSTPARSASVGSVPGVSASSTPLSHYYHAGWSQTPTRKAWVRQQHHHHQHHHQHHRPAHRYTASSSSAVLSPLYCADDLGSPASIRPWYEPMLRRSKLLGVQDEDFCNRSPYTYLGGRHSPRLRLASPGPLYLV